MLFTVPGDKEMCRISGIRPTDAAAVPAPTTEVSEALLAVTTNKST